eukprot:COSAG04_NODE_1045_length_8578_cov_9.398396_10_plen_76_part_00
MPRKPPLGSLSRLACALRYGRWALPPVLGRAISLRSRLRARALGARLRLGGCNRQLELLRRTRRRSFSFVGGAVR